MPVLRSMQKPHSAPLLLLSGLPLGNPSSFLRQLSALATAWQERGRRVLLGGPIFPRIAARLRPMPPRPLWCLQGYEHEPGKFTEIVQRSAATAVIALGYPEQFAFLEEERTDTLPFFLWAQFSRVPRKPLPDWPLYVPLTAKTADFLRRAGCSRIGPIIPHGVDTRLFVPLSVPRSASHAFVVGTIGNNSRRKRFDLIIRAFALLARQWPEARLVLKTNRMVSLDEVDLTALIARANIQEQVEVLVEELCDRQLVELYRRMHVYLNLSEWEGFGIPVIEAMACGIPVVSLPIQGPGEILPYTETLVPESLVHEEDGTLLFEASPQAVCEVLLMLAREETRRRNLGQAGRQHSVSSYDIRRVVDLWEALLY